MSNSILYKPSLKLFFIFSALAFCSYCFYAIYIDQYLFADGSDFLLSLLVKKSVYTPVFSRIGANTMKELLPLLAIIAGLKDINIISKLFGFNYYFAPMLGLAFCFQIVRNIDLNLLFLPLLSFISIFLLNYAYLSVESLYACTVFWPLLLHLLEAKSIDKYLPLVILGMVVLGASYELTVILYPFIFYALATAFVGKRYRHISLFSVILIFALGGFMFSLFYGLNPEVSTLVDNRNDLLMSILNVVNYSPFIFLSLELTFLLVLASKGKSLGRFSELLLLVFIIALSICLILPNVFNNGLKLHPGAQWHFRMMVPGVTFGMAILYLVYRSTPKWEIKIPTLPTLIFILSCIIFQIQLSVGWHKMISQYDNVLKSHSGIVYLDSLDPDTRESIKKYGWSWSNPTMSILLESMSGDTINTMIENYTPVKWIPWNHYAPTSQYPDLSNYGKFYNASSFQLLQDSTYTFQVGY